MSNTCRFQAGRKNDEEISVSFVTCGIGGIEGNRMTLMKTAGSSMSKVGLTQSQHNQSRFGYAGVHAGGNASSGNNNVISGGRFANSSKGGMDEPDLAPPKPKFSVGGVVRSGGRRGILRKEGKARRSGRGVSFPNEVVEVIGYREFESESSDEEDTPVDPQDNSSIAELLEKHAITTDEKEFHKLTQKNTNFNSIKTNLLGKTNIQIGPIVGGTKGSSKPLVSIGTFETRNEPLRIREKVDQDSEDGVGDKSVLQHRKFVSTGQAKVTTGQSIQKSSQVTQKSSPLFSKTAQVPTPSGSNSGSGTIRVENNVVKSMQIQAPAISSKPKPPQKTVFVSSMSSEKIVEKTATASNQNLLNPLANTIPKPGNGNNSSSGAITITSAKDEERWGNPEPKNELDPGSSRNNNRDTKPAVKPKSILKTPNPITTTLPPITNESKSKSNRALTNLIILTEGNSIASKRTSFLRNIFDDEQEKSQDAGNVQKSDEKGVTVIATKQAKEASLSLQLEPDSLQIEIEKDSLEPPKEKPPPPPVNSRERESKPRIKLDLGLSLSALKFPEVVGIGTDSEFDDSLEDSGLDIKVNRTNMNGEESEESDENEKVGGSSGTDSGNEQDYAVLTRAIINKGQQEQGQGLYISVADDELKKSTAKLSPDSVLGVSESSQGSTESVPEALELDQRKGSASSISSGKRQAPQPPNPTKEEEEEEEGVYDDIANVRKETEPEEEAAEDESLYDDCLNTSIPPEEKDKNLDLGKVGSYDFQDSLGDASESEVAKRIDGIEFIGIRKIDSESFLKENSPSRKLGFSSRRSLSPENRERSSSTSPKTRRKVRVNQFFSTIGKKAGAAFSGQRQKSPSVFAAISSSPDPDSEEVSASSSSKYKRSMSSDEVSMSRAQEIYATLTPASLKIKGVLNKLSKMDLNLGKDEDEREKGDSPKKKNISKSIRKFLKMGSGSGSSSKDDFSTGIANISAPIQEMSSISTIASEPEIPIPDESSKRVKPPLPLKPPPPPPRIHSLDLFNKMAGNQGSACANGNLKGTVKPARPPPPVIPAKGRAGAPSFTAVFNSQEETPPSKPKRKNSLHASSTSAGKDLETSYNHIANLNLETLKLLANQPVAKVSSNYPIVSSHETVHFSQFEGTELILSGQGWALHSGHFEGTKCLLLLQGLEGKQVTFSSILPDLTFEDEVSSQFLQLSSRSTFARISVLPFLRVWNLADFLLSKEVDKREKFLAILQALNFWNRSDLDLSLDHILVLRQPHISTCDRVYVEAIQISEERKSSTDFEAEIKQILLTSEEDGSFLEDKDRRILLQNLSGSGSEVKGQLELFFQLKLFTHSRKSIEFLRIKRQRTEQAVQQWLDKERAVCMKEAVERSLAGGSEAMTPLKKVYLEFLMRPGNCAKVILDMFVPELFE